MTTPSTPIPPITGRVSLHDELGERIPFAANVQVNALSLSSVRKYETFPDAAGRLELRQPEEGPTPLRFAREGFGDMFRYEIGDGSAPLGVGTFARSSADVTFQMDGLPGWLESSASGATVHLRAYGATENLASGCENPASGLEIFTDLSDGFASTSLIMP